MTGVRRFRRERKLLGLVESERDVVLGESLMR